MLKNLSNRNVLTYGSGSKTFFYSHVPPLVVCFSASFFLSRCYLKPSFGQHLCIDYNITYFRNQFESFCSPQIFLRGAGLRLIFFVRWVISPSQHPLTIHSFLFPHCKYSFSSVFHAVQVLLFLWTMRYVDSNRKCAERRRVPYFMTEILERAKCPNCNTHLLTFLI